MAAKKRSEMQKARDRKLIGKWYRQGMKVTECQRLLAEVTMIEDNYSLGYYQVLYDLKAMLKQWKEEHRELINDKMEFELSKLDLIESEMWRAWEQSKEGQRKTKYKPNNAAQTNDVTDGELTSSTGNVKYITRIQWCIEMRAKLMGWFVPIREDDPKQQYGEYWEMTPEDIRKEMNKLYSGGSVKRSYKRLN